MAGFALPLCICSLFIIFIISNASDTITQTQSIRDGETIVSSGGSFEMGFFSPGKSKNRYVGIWFKKISVKTVVWVANREIPLTNTTGVLMVKSPGILVLLNGTNETIWSSNTSKSVQSPVAQLLDTGNLIIKNIDDDNLENFVWQSFDYLDNTQIPGMKFGKNLLTGKEWYFSSWKSEDDPSEGDFTYRMDINGYPQPILRTLGSETYRTGPWNGYQFSGSSNLGSNEFFNFSFVFNEEEVYYTYPFNSSEIMRGELSYDGHVKRWTWSKQKGTWVLYSNRPDDNCDHYAICGVNSICRVNYSPICTCMDKFSPKHPEDWNLGDWSKGCIRRKRLACERGEGFLKFSGLKLADTSNSWFSRNMTLEECKRMCLENCSCVAYSNIDVRGKGSGCLLWFHDLIDVKGVPENGQDIYVRMPSSELEAVAKDGHNDRRKRKIIVSLASTIGGLLCLSLILCVWWRRVLMKRKDETTFSNNHNSESHSKDLSLPLFDLATILKATDNFSMSNKVGEGGYGPVYKGLLEGGQEIAVKRLSKDSRQGLDEFKNEVIFIAKLQHRNLVKLLGCCIQGEDKMLIYEYMANKSLDSFIFDKTKNALLDWPMRFHIINGISRGLVYLHQDSRLRIIHRDLKTSNILLDTNMNPKISDFGMARSFKENEAEENTTRVVGTYGYMPPEYAMHGIFSVKSDVYSFGVLVLEIVSGKKNRDFSHLDHPINLLGHAWKLYRDGKSLELVDASIISSCHISEMLRSIHVALLCVQERRIDRPSMASVVLMLGSDTTLPQPKQPGFYTQKDYLQAECSTSRETPGSSNGITITEVEAR